MFGDSETELKLRIIDKNTWKTLPKFSWLQNLSVLGSVTLQPMESTYYDTPSRSLWKANYSFRIHQEEKGWIATLKKERASRGGLHHHREWNVALPGPELNPEIWVQMSGADKVVKLLHGQPGLAPLFKIVSSRWFVLVNFQTDAALFELSMYRGVISTEDNDEDINELEINLRKGTARDLLSFTAELSRQFLLPPENTNQYHRGLRLAGLSVASKEKFSASWPPTGRRFGDEAIGTVLAAQTDCFAKAGTVEELHVLRVSLRKLRSYLSFNAPLYSSEEVNHWKEVLGKWSRLMTGIRELDVLMEEWSNAAEQCEIDGSSSQLTAYWNEQRKKHGDSLNKLIAKGKLTTDLLAFQIWISGEEKNDEATHEGKSFSIQRLEKWLKNMRRDLEQVDLADAEAMHNLMIQGKKPRYIMEQ